MAHKRWSENLFADAGFGLAHPSDSKIKATSRDDFKAFGSDSHPITDDAGNSIITGGPLRTAPYLYRYPLGLLVWYWLQYYYPIFEHDGFIPQKNGESSRMEKGKTMAIRRDFTAVIFYYTSRGGFAQLYFDLLRVHIPVHSDP
jgi:hypothetical protein